MIVQATKGATGGVAGNTIYTGDGSLSSNRAVSLNGKTLTILGSNISQAFDDAAQTITFIAPNGVLVGGVVILSTSGISTDNGTTTWLLGGSTASVPTPDAYIFLTVNGQGFRIPAETV